MEVEKQDVESLIEHLNQESENKPIENFDQQPTIDQPAAVFEEPAPEQKPEEPLTKDRLKRIAMSWINRFDSIQKMIFRPLYRKRILEPHDIEKYNEFKRRHSGKSDREVSEAISNDTEMWSIAQRMEKCAKAIEELPLTPEEKEELVEPLSELVQKYRKMQLSPEANLGIALGLIMLTRLTPLIPDFGKIFSSNE